MLLTLGITKGRASFGYQIAFMYYLLAIPVLWCIYLAWVIPQGSKLGPLVQAGLLIGAACTVAINAPGRLAAARAEHAVRQAFEQDLRDGKPSYRLIGAIAYARAHNPNFTDPLVGSGALDGENPLEKGTDYLRMLREAGIGAYRYLREDPRFRVMPIPLEPIELGEVEWDPREARGAFRGFVSDLRPPRADPGRGDPDSISRRFNQWTDFPLRGLEWPKSPRYLCTPVSNVNTAGRARHDCDRRQDR